MEILNPHTLYLKQVMRGLEMSNDLADAVGLLGVLKRPRRDERSRRVFAAVPCPRQLLCMIDFCSWSTLVDGPLLAPVSSRQKIQEGTALPVSMFAYLLGGAETAKEGRALAPRLRGGALPPSTSSSS
jgi:hypothetical protein